MDKNLTELVFILDRSGSMGGLESDTIGGFNSFIKNQSKIEGKTTVTTVLFDDKCEVLWDGVDANKIKLTNKEYFIRGTTALLDAVGKTINIVGARLASTSEDKKPSKVIFAITTDGLENASKEYSYEEIHEMIGHQKEKYNWDFIFLGANIDVEAEAENLGISKNDAFSFIADSEGINHLYNSLDACISKKRKSFKDLDAQN